MENILNILEQFNLNGNISDIKKINSGHINLTYIVIYSNGKSYILQKLNRNVFKNPDKVMSNIKLLCDTLKNNCKCPVFLESNNKNYIVSNNEIWRIYEYIKNSVSFVNLDSLNYIYEFGKVIGNFHKATENLDTSNFYTTIEDFHNSVWRIKELLTLKNRKYNDYFDFFFKVLKYAKILESKNLSLHVTHNDVKCSNVLFNDRSGSGITLIDFDTVMPGLWAHDFGDGARSACVSKNNIDTNKLQAYCKGYFSVIKSGYEDDYFLGMICITSELSARYFYDYLTDGNYFSDKSPYQKLQRCNELIELSNSIIIQKNKIAEIIFNNKK